MAESVDRKIKLPDGKVAVVRVPSDWTPEDIKAGLIERGLIEGNKDEGGFLSAIAEIPGAIGRGFEKGVEEVAHTGADVREAIYGALPFLKNNLVEQLIPGTPEQLTQAMRSADLPSLGSESKSLPGNIAEVVTQFGVGALTSPVKGGFIKSMVQGAWADISAFDPEKTQTLSTALNEVPGLASIVPDILVSNPDDSRWEGKVKNALEGAGIGALADAVVIPTLRGLKNSFTARLVKEVPPEAAPKPTLALPAPERQFDVDPSGQATVSQAPNTTRAEGIVQKREQTRANLAESRNQSDIQNAIKQADLQKEVEAATRQSAFDALQAQEKAKRKLEVDAAYSQKAADNADDKINDLIRRSTYSPSFKQGGQIDPAVFREGITQLYNKSKDLFEFTRRGKEQFGPYFDPIAESLYRSLRAELGEVGETPVPRARAGGYNPNKFNTTEEIQQYTDELISKFGESKEVRKWSTIKEQALKLGMSRRQIDRLRSESKNWTARIKAAHDVALDSWETTQKSAIRAVDGTPEDLSVFYTKMVEDAELLNSIVGIRSEAGRVLNSLKMMSESRGETSEMFRKFLEGQGGEASLRSIAQKVAEASPTEGRRLARRALKENTLFDAVLEYWFNWGLLSGPQTHVTNFLSTGVNMAASIPEMYVSAGLGKVLGSQDRITAAQANKYVLGFKQSMYDAIRSVGKSARQNDAILVVGNREVVDELSKVELEAHRAWNSQTFAKYVPQSVLDSVPQSTKDRVSKLVDKSGSVVRTPGQALFLADAFWKTFGYRTKLNQLAQDKAEQMLKSGKIDKDEFAQTYQNFIDNPTKEIHDQALHHARYRTFTKELGDTGKKLQSITAEMPALKFVFPFVRVASNIFKYAGERTPFALASKKVRDHIMAGGRERDEALSKIILGSSLGMAALEMAAGGVLTGSAPRDPESRSNFYESGRIPYSVKVGDEWHSISRLEPLSTIMGLAADMHQAWDYMSNGQRDQAVAALGLGMGEVLINKTFMSSAQAVLQSITNPERYGTKWLEGTLGTLLVPNVLAQVARDVDPRIKVHIERIEDILQVVDERTPWKRSEIINRLNRWGEPLEFNGNMLNPIWDSEVTDSKFLQSMYKNDVQLGNPPKNIFGVELSPALYNKYVKMGRIPARRQLEEIYNTSNISSLSPELQEKMIKKVVKQWDNYARQRMIPLIRKEVLSRKVQEATSLLTPAKEVIRVRAE